MAKTAKALLQVAAKEVGYSRYTDPEQGTKYGRWYAKITNSPYFGTTGVPFCAMFVSWCLAQLGITATGCPTAACTSGLLAAARSAGKLIRVNNAMPGDIVLFDWSYGGYYSSSADHTGFCVKNNDGVSLETIEGNVGGAVARRTRPYSCIVGVIRPNFEKGIFSDVDESTPHYSDILWAKQKNITTGYSDNTFRPYTTVSRCAMAAFLYRLAGSPNYSPTAKDKNRFKDVTSSTSFAKEIWWLGSKGITQGYSDGTFRPYNDVYRCDMAAFLYRFAGSPNYIPSEKEQKIFSDVNNDTAHAKEIQWLAYKGISKGYSNGTFRPYTPLLRCDAMAFIHRV